MFAGKPGRTGRLVLNPGAANESRLRGSGQYQLSAGSVIRFEGAGAGAFGDPMRRDPSAVERDVRAGYVSIDAARQEYGVIIHPETLTLDVRATEVLRGKS